MDKSYNGPDISSGANSFTLLHSQLELWHAAWQHAALREESH